MFTNVRTHVNLAMTFDVIALFVKFVANTFTHNLNSQMNEMSLSIFGMEPTTQNDKKKLFCVL